MWKRQKKRVHSTPGAIVVAKNDRQIYNAAMDESLRKRIIPGARISVTQQIPARDHVWTSNVTGTVIEFDQQKTGSWFAHSRDDKLWLDRLVLRKDDGEITTLNLDDYTHIEMK